MTAPFTWLVFDIIDRQPTILGAEPQFIAGRASVDWTADLITVTAPNGRREVTQIGGSDARQLAKQLLAECTRQDPEAAAPTG